MSSSKADATPDGAHKQSKLSLWQRFQEGKRSKPIPEEDLIKYLGMTRKELHQWAETTPGVGKNQLSGKVTQGDAAGFGGVSAAFGYGGWGPSAEPRGPDQGMKFPPLDSGKQLGDSESVDKSAAEGEK
ncbi:hypothetical protein FBEOM_13813 [Fusarium beomiforme]|uniref:Uncharacterized protein n=1 Tax=Fusarium beomiforme TaxID=44412 RepID=A0A9P5A506_9HYPO|nr:hypothetical protein FBEOM_13813 [Fusarium beomiforme]